MFLTKKRWWKSKCKSSVFHFFILLEKGLQIVIKILIVVIPEGFPGGASGKELTCQCKRLGFHPWVGKIPWRRECLPTPVFSPGKSHGQRSLVGYSPWGCRVRAYWNDLAHTLLSGGIVDELYFSSFASLFQSTCILLIKKLTSIKNKD